jgi:GNAT superfamily N-acetyltransferase
MDGDAHAEETLTYLEMTAPSQLIASRPVGEVTLEPLDGLSPLIRPVQVEIGRPYGWPSVSRSDHDWAEWLSHPDRRYWLINYGSEVAGIVDFEPHGDGEVEITTFGLVPKYVGRGLGGHALTLAVRQAWGFERADGAPVRRIWLHTSARDHPNALRNYERRGFRRCKDRP